ELGLRREVRRPAEITDLRASARVRDRVEVLLRVSDEMHASAIPQRPQERRHVPGLDRLRSGRPDVDGLARSPRGPHEAPRLVEACDSAGTKWTRPCASSGSSGAGSGTWAR